MDWLEAVILGLIQGLTEFLPVSSDGHLATAQMFFGAGRSAEEDVLVDVLLHFGTVTAILVFYRSVIREGVRGLLGSNDVPPDLRRGSLIRMAALVFVALLPLIPDKLFFLKRMEAAFHNPVAVGVGFWITAAALLVTARLKGGTKGPAETTWIDALLIGLAQALAPLPGVSRSGMTIAMALALGLSRTWAVGFSFAIGVPAILGAVVFKLKEFDPTGLTGERVAQVLVATVIAGVVGYMAIIWLIRIVQRGQLWYFSVYLILLGALVLATGVAGTRREQRPAGTRSTDRSVRIEPATADARRLVRSIPGDLDRADRVGSRPDRVDAGPARDRDRASGRHLG